MKASQKIILAVLLVLLLAALAAVLFTWNWSNYRERLRAMRTASRGNVAVVDTHPLDTAQQLAQLAVTHTEKDYAQEALRLADYSVDAAFTAALEDATDNPAPLTPETKRITARLKAAETAVEADQNRIAQLNQQIPKARLGQKDTLQQQLNLVQAQLEFDQDDLADAHEDLIRAGGDKYASVQRLKDQHEASQQHSTASQASATAATAAPPIELTQLANVVAQAQAWLSLNSKQKLLQQAHQNALDRDSKLSESHNALEKEVNEEKAQKKILHRSRRHAAKATAPANTTNPIAPPATNATPTEKSPTPAGGSGGPAETNPAAVPAGADSTLTFLKDLTIDQRNLSQLDKRIENEQQLAELYGKWITYVGVRKQAFLHGLFLSVFWILLIVIFIFGANEALQRFFSDLSPERRQLHTMRAVLLFAVQALGIILVLLVIFGLPGNLAAVIALAGAGLTVALKDFIVGFFGWFILMGKDGIRPGDWVEINGVGGEVLEVGLFHTVLLETGNWADAAHPTGRKVTFVNSFAVEGHYFNFSTSGQWLWDELQVLVPPTADPYPIAEAIQKMATAETAQNAQLAEKEWERVTPAYAKRSFTAAPSMTVRPSGEGVNVIVRYLTRANERQEVRSRLYRAAVELLRKRNISQPVTPDAPPQSVGNRTV
jgi:small-conductance mechanosensitive channel